MQIEIERKTGITTRPIQKERRYEIGWKCEIAKICL